MRSKDEYAQRGWLDFAAGLLPNRDAERVEAAAIKIAKARPDWVKITTVEKLFTIAEHRIARLTRKEGA